MSTEKPLDTDIKQEVQNSESASTTPVAENAEQPSDDVMFVPEGAEGSSKENPAPNNADPASEAEPAPAESSAELTTTPASSAGQASGNKDKGKDQKFCVLIIEEKADLRTFYMSALTKTGNFDVINSATPTEALGLLNTEFEKINLVIFDWVMPEIPGYVFCQKMRADNRFNHIEILICSAEIDSEDSFLMVEMDIHHVMPKLTNAGEYIERVEKVRTSYHRSHSVVSKLKNLHSLLSEFKLEQCEELFKIPEIENEVNINPRYAYLGGEVRILRKKYEEAAGFLKEFLQRNSVVGGADNLKSLSTLGKALCLSGKFEDALLIFERLESKSPKNLSHKIMAGDALLGMDEVGKAEGKYNEVLSQDPTNKDANVGLGKVNAANGDMQEAKSFFSKIEGNFESRSLASFFNNRGVALVRRGDVNGAIAFYENALQFLDKFKGLVYFNLGMAYLRIGNVTSAVHSFQASLNSQESNMLAEKTLLKELKEKGVDKFISDLNKLSKPPKNK